jgi:LIVCS family branched-chain amino acid:cation transporter
MLFGLFFGAGNLIFPVNMGQNAGASVFAANLGFLVTAVGLPFLSVIAIGITGSNGVRELASRSGKKYAFIFTILLYLAIGPFCALPRLATTSFTVGLQPFLSAGLQKPLLLAFSLVFFGLACIGSLKPKNLMNLVGKFLNPLFLVLLALLIAFAFIHPLGTVKGSLPVGGYAAHPFSQGMTDGYNTLDLLAGLAFGIVVISSLKDRGLKNNAEIAITTTKSGILVVVFMALIYTCLSFMGALSLGHFSRSSNGGIALSQIARYYMGTAGLILLAFIITIACLKTAIGLVTSCASAAVELFPRVKYNYAAVVTSILSALIANAGLDTIIQASVPVLMFLYPLAISLCALALIEALVNRIIGKSNHYNKSLYVWMTIFTGIGAFFDALSAAPALLRGWAPVAAAIKMWSYVPLASHGLGWLLPALLGLLCGFIISKTKT